MGTKKAAKTVRAKVPGQPRSFRIWLLPLLMIITAIVYQGALDNGFTNWDDNINITENADLLSYHGGSLWPQIASYFKVRNDMVMYEPLTRIGYLLVYSSHQVSPGPYHTLNLVLHLLNCLLVFYFIWLLCGQQWVAFFTALLFGIHPMHVESVAWVTGLIDLLYSFFYLAALCTYLLYLKKEKWKWQLYSITLLLFVISLLSKAAAVTLPVILVIIDYFQGRKISRRTVADKIPFVLPAIIFGYIAIYAQQKNAVPEGLSHTGFADRILFTCYALAAYLWKFVAPVGLCNFYAYPSKHVSGPDAGQQMYPVLVYAAPVILAALLFLIYRSGCYRKDVLFGSAFFLVSVMLVLPGLAKRNTIMADRYTYLAYTGLFFVLARVIVRSWETRRMSFARLKMALVAAFAIFLISCGYLTAGRCEVWHDSMSLWTDAIRTDPGLELAYINRGDTYLAQKRYEDAIRDYNTAIALKASDADAYYNRGNAYCALNRYDTAVLDYTRALRYKPDYTKAFVNRGNTYSVLRQYDRAIPDYTAAISLSPGNGMYYNNRAAAYFATRQFQSAMDDMMKAKQAGFYIDTAFVRSIRMNIDLEKKK